MYLLSSRLTRLGIGLLLTACAAVPTQELSDARQAIQAAEQAGAADLLAPGLVIARQRLERAEQDAGAGHLAQARAGALDAKQAALELRRLAARIREAQAALEESRSLGALWIETEHLLQLAREAAAQGQGDTADQLLLRVTQQRELALNQYYLGQAEQNLRRLDELGFEGHGDWRERLERARAAYHADAGREAFEQSGRLLRETGTDR